MLVKKFFKPFLPFRNTTALAQKISAYHVTHVKKLKDEVQSKPLDNITSDMLSKELNTMLLPKVVMCLEKYENVVNGSHIVMALSKFMKFYLNKKSTNELKEFHDKNFLRQIESIVNPHVHKTSAYEALLILQYLERMEVPKNLGIIQTLFTRIEDHLFDLSLMDIIYFATLTRKFLKFFESSSIIRKLKHHFIMKMAMEFDENDISHLDRTLSFMVFNMQNHELEYMVIDKLVQYKHEIPLDRAVTILESLCEHFSITHRHREKWMDLYSKIINTIINKSENLNADQIIHVLYTTSEMIKVDRTNQYYNAKFYDKVVQQLISQNVGFEKALSALKSLNFIRHENEELLNYCCATYYEKSVLGTDKIVDEAGKLLILINGLAMSSHNSLLWSQVEEFITKNKELLLHYDYSTLCILSVNLACLNCYPHFLLERVFDGKFDYSQGDFLHWSFCKLYQKLKFDPKYSGPMPTKSQIQSLESLVKKALRRKEHFQFVFLKHLIQWLGNEQFVQTNVETKFLHVIDYLLVFDQNGEPVPINTSNQDPNSIQYLEDIDIPPGCKMVCILHMPYYWFSRNRKRLLGMYAITIKTLETLNCEVVHINKSDWDSIPDDQKKDFLINKVKPKINSC